MQTIDHRAGEFFRSLRALLNAHEESGEPIPQWRIERIISDAYHQGVQHGMDHMQQYVLQARERA